MNAAIERLTARIGTDEACAERWRAATAREIAGRLGVTPDYIRQVVIRYEIKPTGRRGTAKLYNPHHVLRRIGGADRQRGTRRYKPRDNLRVAV